jgi:pyrroline-5-carboxylate reductase
MRIGFIGGGIMGEALIRSMVVRNLAAPKDIAVSDISQARRDTLSQKYQIKTTASSLEAAKDADIVVLAIKPQDMKSVLAELRGLSPKQLVLSIMAGITIDSINRGLNHPYIVRAMPNMPAQIGEGVTVWTATSEVSHAQKDMARQVIAAAGEEIYVSNEKYIDMATALSGSGPAYIFLIIEAFIDAGVHIGLPRDIAEKLAIQTIVGSARSIKATGKHPAELRNMVTSPGGTTTEGILQLETGGIRSLLLKAVIAGYEKSKSLGSK